MGNPQQGQRRPPPPCRAVAPLAGQALLDMWATHRLRGAAGNPGAFECDELVPVSRGGSPFDRDNVAAHRCCNNWRRARSVAEVSAVRRALREHLAAWNSPESFVELCKALKSERIPFISPPSAPEKQPRQTTSW